MSIRIGAASIALAAISTLVSSEAVAQSSATAHYDLPSQDLELSLRAVGRISGRQIIIASGAVRERTAPALRGDFSADEAVRRLTLGTGIAIRYTREAILVGVARAESAQAESPERDNDIVVTGSRIRGAALAAPLVRVDREAIRDGGYRDLGDVVRDLPQAFGGGQNPAVIGGGYPDSTFNLNSASSLNLRGLGSDATLTLVNGRRMAFGGSSQAIDISAIPIEMVDRVEVVTDGASAIYGSDAVGGVANLFLKPDYDGLAVTAGLGTATDGGDFEQHYSVTGGKRWTTGGFVAGYDFTRNTAITADQRSYTSKLDPTATLFPYRKAHSAALSAHQTLGDSLEVSLDAFYNSRRHRYTSPFSVTAPYDYYGSVSTARTTTWGVAPTVEFRGIAGWTIGANATYGESRLHYSTIVASGGANLYDTHGCYCSKLTAFEVNADGALFTLPGGPAKLAVGAGYRRNSLDYSRERTNFRPITTPPQYFVGVQENIYAYGEIFLPLLASAGQSSKPLASLSGALRYENYNDMDAVTTPKIGIVISPSPDFDLKGTWGKSFKAPTLYQQALTQETYLYDVTGYGTGFPTGSTILYRAGGNPDLQAERATSWTATVDVHPRSIPDLNISASLFHIRYSDRVVQPILSAAGVLNNTAYSDLVILAPNSTQIADAIDSDATGITNFTSGAYDPAKVVAIVDNRYVNVAVQKIKGADFAASYRLRLREDQSLLLQAGASYLESEQKLAAGLPTTQLAGTLFNPSHWRARGGATWKNRNLSLSTFLNYVGDVSDRQYSPTMTVKGQPLVDITFRFNIPETFGFLRGVEIQATARNVLNDKPSINRTVQPSYVPVDASNYSIIGRFLSFQLTKRW